MVVASTIIADGSCRSTCCVVGCVLLRMSQPSLFVHELSRDKPMCLFVYVGHNDWVFRMLFTYQKVICIFIIQMALFDFVLHTNFYAIIDLNAIWAGICTLYVIRVCVCACSVRRNKWYGLMFGNESINHCAALLNVAFATVLKMCLPHIRIQKYSCRMETIR